jgi:hypothetical protein
MGSQALQVSGQLIFNNPAVFGVIQQLQQLGLFVNVNGQNAVCMPMTVPTGVPLAIPVSSLSALGWYLIINIDQNNGTAQLWNSVSGVPINLINPTEFCMGRFDTSVTAPALLSTGATACQVAIIIVEP